MQVYSYAGWSMGNVGYAHNRKNGNVLFRVSGPLAAYHHQSITDAHRSGYCSITRADVQLTLYFNHDYSLLASDYYDGLVSRFGEKMKQHIELRATNGKGDTLYIGSPEARKRGRVYDKMRESKIDQYENAWRYELQARREAAIGVIDAMLKSEYPHTNSIGIVRGFFNPRGVTVPLPGAEIRVREHRAPRSVDKTCNWLGTTVYKAIQHLTPIVGYDTIAALLKIDADRSPIEYGIGGY
jgi:DNA relaxase NicK